jgi:hypothetical protein
MKHATARTLLRAGVVLLVPALYSWLKYKDEEWYRQLPWRERWLYLHVPVGDSQILQIPLPQELGAAFASVPIAALDSLYRSDPRAFKSALGHLAEVANPFDWPTLAKLGWEQGRNKVSFFGSPIIPRGELDLIPGAQRGEHTSWLGRKLGDAFPTKMSPRRVDAALRTVFGGVGTDLADSPAAFMRMLGMEVADRESEPSDIWVYGRAFRRGGKYNAGSVSLTDYWDDFTRYGELYASEQRDLKAGRDPLVSLSYNERAYAQILQLHYGEIKLLLEMAKLSPAQEDRQEFYRLATNRAEDIVAIRPKGQDQDELVVPGTPVAPPPRRPAPSSPPPRITVPVMQQ